MGIETISTQLLLDIADFIYIAVDVNQKVSLINRKGCEILGYSEDEVIGKNWFDNFLPKEVAKEIKSDFIKRIAKNKKTKQTSNYAILSKEGEEKIISWNSTFFKDEEGNLRGVLSSGLDITEETKTKKTFEAKEGKRRENEERFRALFEEMKQAYALYEVIYDNKRNPVDAILVEINPEYEKIVKRKREEIIGKKISEIYPNLKKQEINPIVVLGTTAITGETVTSEYFNKDVGKWFLAKSFSPMKDHVAVLFDDITEKRETKVKLEKERMLLQQYLDIANVMLIVIDANEIVITINKRGCKILGYEKEEIIGKNWFENFIPKRRKAATRDVFKELMSGKLERVDHLENFILTKEGEERCIEYNNTYILDEYGNITSILSSGQDITERKNAEQARLYNEKRYKELFNKMSDGVVVLEAVKNGKDFLVKDYNRAGELIDNRKREQVVGKLLSEAFPGSEEGGFTAQMRRVWKSGETERLLLSFYQDDLTEGWRKNYTYRLPSKEVVCVYEDVTKEQQNLKNLESSEERYRELFFNVPVALSQTKPNGEIVECNSEFVKMFGYENAEELKKIHVRELYYDPDERDAVVAIEDKLGFYSSFLQKMKKKDGSAIWTDINSKAFYDENKKVTHYDTSLKDLTENKEMEDRLVESEERLRGLFENIPLAITINTSDGALIDMNAAFWKLFGYADKKECLSTSFTKRWFNIRDRDRLYDSLRQRNIVHNFEVKRCKKDGSEFWASISAIAHTDTSREREFFTTIRDITSEKQIEDELRRQTLRYHLEESNLYLTEEERPYVSKEAFSDLLRIGYKGLVLSRSPETEWRKDINYEFDFFRIAEKGHLKIISSELSKIELLIEELPSKHVIIIDRLDYLIAKNGFETTLFFIFRLMDISYISNHIIIVSLDPTTTNEKERRSLRKEMRMIESIAEASLPEELIEILNFVHKKNITGDKPSYTDIVDTFNISRPTARKRIKDLINEEFIFELTKGRRKVLGITAKGKSIFE
ncbi:MAG: PAS domain S-box protein [Candidatus Heimdallarchaeaceae archaeon]